MSKFALAKVCSAPAAHVFWSLTAGQIHDCIEAEKALDFIRGSILIADKGYDSTRIARAVESRGIRAMIPCRSARAFPQKINYRIYRRRIIIERSFHDLKRYRAISTRYCKTAHAF